MPDLDLVPRKSRGHHLEEVEGEFVLFGRLRAKAFFLNESASVVWKLCDGTRSIREIVGTLAEAFPENASDIQVDVVQTIDNLVSEGALAYVEKPGGSDH